MKKLYLQPDLERNLLNSIDVITASGDDPGNTPGETQAKNYENAFLRYGEF